MSFDERAWYKSDRIDFWFPASWIVESDDESLQYAITHPRNGHLFILYTDDEDMVEIQKWKHCNESVVSDEYVTRQILQQGDIALRKRDRSAVGRLMYVTKPDDASYHEYEWLIVLEIGRSAMLITISEFGSFDQQAWIEFMDSITIRIDD